MSTAGFITVLVLLSIAALVLVEIAGMPGRTARARNHPNADAINLLGYLGLLLGLGGWLLAMVWARIDHLQIGVERIQNAEPADAKSDEQ